ncbi:hypothetical protein PVAND_012072 [Polypedilum vanderplanki]|uniref:Ubiquitin-like domain-containing protein n=1 Tax=Polypedilum vanderplanki TaxID=319348 RepID=A0A9J6CM80_POLVA|nr:hypothetical protein PVAND_012072 [Polypedilum vanderplanki]
MAHLEETNQNQKIEIQIVKTTGGSFEVTVENDITVENLKKIVSKKLKISKDRICLMNSERELQDGTLTENGIVNGSKIIVTPNVETGLAQRNAENTVMQALESLNDNQVNDFLSGKSPLNLSVRLGDHLMMIQLQLSTLSPSQQNSLKQKVANTAAQKQAAAAAAASRSIINCDTPSMSYSTSGCKRALCNSEENAPEKQKQRTDGSDETRSPIKSLSSMVSSPISTTTVQNLNHNFYKAPSPSVDPISANLTSCLCKRLNISCNNNCNEQQRTSPSTIDEPCCSTSLSSSSGQSNSIPRLIPFHHRPQSTPVVIKPKQLHQLQNQQQQQHKPSSSSLDLSNETFINTDNPALAEASRNLTQTLRKLSKRVFTSKAHIMDNNVVNRSMTSSSSSSSSSSNISSSSGLSSNSSGAVIESMKQHGKGIYSGTFSGTLNPALQDKNGRPKRDISTIIHILNDLLSATPQCAKNGTKIFFEPTQTSAGSSSSATKYIKIKKQSSSKTSCMRCIPQQSQHQKCAYGQCNGHKTEIASTSNGSSSSHCIPASRSEDCTECNQTLINQKLEMENMKTKSKLESLKLVMQQKKERREARKLKLSPYNTQHSITAATATTLTAQTVIPVPLVSASNNSINGGASHNRSTLNGSADGTSTSATISASISSENHLEEVETVA